LTKGPALEGGTAAISYADPGRKAALWGNGRVAPQNSDPVLSGESTRATPQAE